VQAVIGGWAVTAVLSRSLIKVSLKFNIRDGESQKIPLKGLKSPI
jgi:hypothetical protein